MEEESWARYIPGLYFFLHSALNFLIHETNWWASCFLHPSFTGYIGGLSLAVEGSSKAEISCHDNKDGTVSVSYLPTAPGEYKVDIP